MSFIGLLPALGHAEISTTGDVDPVPASGVNLTVGRDGVGTFNVDNGSTLDLSGIRVGENTGSDGTAVIEGAGTELTLSGTLNLGVSGTGSMEIRDGARVESLTAITSMGQNADGVGSLLITGAGSIFQGGGGNGNIGFRGSGTLIVEDGGRYNAFDRASTGVGFNIGNASTGTGSITVRSGGIVDFTFDNPGNNNDQIIFGNSEGTGSLTVENGGQFLSQTTFFGTDANTEGTFVITGASSTATLRDLDLAQSVGSKGTATITDGATVTITEDFFMSRGDSEVTISAGATVEAGDDIALGWGGSDTAHLTVTGNGTELTGNDFFWVGFQSDAILEVGRGATVTATANDISTGRGIGFGIAGGATGTLRMVIGDDGTGTVRSGFVDAGGFLINTGTGLLEIDVDDGIVLNLGDTFQLLGYDTWDGDFFDNVVDGGVISGGGYDWRIDYDADIGGRNGVVATVIPELSSFMLALIAATGCVGIKWVRSRR